MIHGQAFPRTASPRGQPVMGRPPAPQTSTVLYRSTYASYSLHTAASTLFFQSSHRPYRILLEPEVPSSRSVLSIAVEDIPSRLRAVVFS